ncbi:MAG: hemolysin III family protein, partial [Oscillospiraceae bacterium]|nr:hemolysin III family protein [Oscillospiraceae bacterium]
MEQAIFRAPYDSAPRRRERPTEKGRDPYDGLRPWSAITHGVGAVLAVIGAAALLIGAAAGGGNVWKLVSFAIYGLSMAGLYTASTLYHCVNTTVEGRIALRKFDHASIYFLIAGSYTPVCLIALRGPWGWSLFGVIWALAIAGLVMSLAWIDCPRALTSTIYIAMGWLAVVAVYPLWQARGPRGVT